MNKSIVNKYCRKFGFEIHGTGYMQSVEKNTFKEDAFLKQHELSEGNCAVIFDVGANIGDTAISYHQLFPAAKIYAFEPFPASFTSLSDRVSGISKIRTFQNGIADRSGKMKFYVNHNTSTNSLLVPQKMGLSSDKQVANKNNIEVEVITIDNFCEANNIIAIDILKLDIQGGELAALKGAAKMLANKKINLIYTEAYFRQQYIDQPLLHEISTYLYQYGYCMQDMYNPIYGKGALAWCDVIFIKESK